MKRYTAEKLEALGQMRLPGIDQLRELFCSLRDLVKAVATVCAISIKETTKSITARVGQSILRLSGDARDFLSAADVEAEVAGLADSEAIDALCGLGFELVGERQAA